jgi:hydrogenase maturation protein HypF
LKDRAELIRVRGLVQGVGFRPTVWRLAHSLGLRGWVANDGDGVLIYACGAAPSLDALVDQLPRALPPLARVNEIVRSGAAVAQAPAGEFVIAASAPTGARTAVVPDAATCPACVAEIFDPSSRRCRYPFTNCTHCGPRLTIMTGVPYDRERTTMAAFPLCEDCAREYHDPQDRRFHAQPVACPACGPRLRLERTNGEAVSLESAPALLEHGAILAVKGLGGFQLACDATNEAAVARLRRGKRRDRKPFALMASDMEVIRRYCQVDALSEALLASPAAPIVILPAHGAGRIAASVAPGVGTLGFMLPNTPLHHLLLRHMPRPIVLTSGNLSDEPQCIDLAQAKARLESVAELFLTHDRDIVQRVDDSVVRIVGGAPRVLRRARGYAPAPISLPPGFDHAAQILAFGGELKNTFCLLRDGQAILSHHIGDLENAGTYADYQHALARYQALFGHRPRLLAADLHPEYLSSKLAREMAGEAGLPLVETQHHHAHIAACLAENQVPLDAPPVLGVALDGLGFGPDGGFWGGEFLRADYRSYERLGTFKPVAMIGGSRAIREPWRNTYAHLMAAMGWPRFEQRHRDLELCSFLAAKDRCVLDGMLARRINSPLASSCGRLFDAVAAAVGVCRSHADYEGQAAIELEALADEAERLAYPFSIQSAPLPYIEPQPMWQALLEDLALGTPAALISARFHRGLAQAITAMASRISGHGTVALSGGVFQNRLLFCQLVSRLEAAGFTVLTHRAVPPNDGGLALGQAVIAAAKGG